MSTVWLKPLAEITIDDLQQLIDEGYVEDQFVEYKLALWRTDPPPKGQSDPRHAQERVKQIVEFLKDCSAFANADGGLIVVGMKATKGKATQLVGQQISDVDGLKQQLESFLKAGIDPRISVDMRGLVLNDGATVMLISIAPSTIGPHQVRYNDTHQFWRRTNAGAVQMSVSELREAFLMTGRLFDLMRAFPEERIAIIDRGSYMMPLAADHQLIVHLMPLESFSSSRQYAPRAIAAKMLHFRPLGGYTGVNPKIGFDGVAFFSNNISPVGDSHILVLRNGIVEIVVTDIVRIYEGRRYLLTERLTNELSDTLKGVLVGMKELGISPPIWACATLRGLKEVTLRANNYAEKPVGATEMRLPEMEISDYTTDIDAIVREWNDRIWNSAGYDNCYLYDDSGKYKGR